MISNASDVIFYSRNLTMEAYSNNHRSLIHFANYPRTRKTFKHQRVILSSCGYMVFDQIKKGSRNVELRHQKLKRQK